MNWKLKLVLWFTGLGGPVGGAGTDIPALRKQSNSASRLGTLIFDKKMKVAEVSDTSADGIPVRIYQPDSGTGKRTIIYYHGGGFVLYGLDSHDAVCRRIAVMNDAVIVSVDYRLAPEHSYPAAHDDAFSAVKWSMKNIGEYGGNASDIVVMGDSTGANLAACVAHRCKEHTIKLTAQVLIYPWIDGKLANESMDKNGKGYMLTKDTVRWFQQQYTPDPAQYCVPGVSPCYQPDHTGLAPAFVLTAEFDPLLDDGYKYYEQLKAAGNKAQYKEYKGLIHGFINLPGVDANAMQAYVDIREFLRGV